MSVSLVESGIRPIFANAKIKNPIQWEKKGNEIQKDFEEFQSIVHELVDINLKIVDDLPPLRINKNEIKSHLRNY